MREISVNSLKSEKNESLATQKDEKASGNRNCDLIWNIRYEDQKREIFFRNTCANLSCMITWKSINMLGIGSPMHYDHIPPQSEQSYAVSSQEMEFEVDYYFQ